MAEQTEAEKQQFYMNLNLKGLNENLSKLTKVLEGLNRNVGLISDPKFKEKYKEYLEKQKQEIGIKWDLN